MGTSELRAVEQRLFEGLNSAIRPVERTAFYRAALVIASAAMVLLPVIYLGIIASLGYGAYWYGVHGFAFFEGSLPGILKIIGYVGPLIAAVIAVFFMFKPIFAPAGDRPALWELRYQKEPLFFHFARKVARAVHAPQPRRIFVDCSANASASFEQGTAAFFRPSLALTVGLPLLRDMNTREMAGILAHEFGHFSQGAGMRLSFIVRSINGWFERVIYERDEWDGKLEAFAKGSDFRIAIALHLARGMVWLTRKILWCLMMLGHLISMYLLRQMEFDADRHEIRLAGSDQFPATSRKLTALMTGWQVALSKISDSWQDGKLPRDFAGMVSHSAQSLDQSTVQKIDQELKSGETGIWDTHPSTHDRVVEARRQRERGVYRVQEPCQALFGDFDALSASCSAHFYQQLLGEPVRPDKLVTTEEVVRQTADMQNDHEAFQRFFGETIDLFLPLQLHLPEDVPADAAGLTEALRREYSGHMNNLDAIKREAAARDRRREHLLKIIQGKGLLQAGYGIEPTEFSMTEPNLESAAKSEDMTRRSLGLGSSELLRLLEPLRRRLELALVHCTRMTEQTGKGPAPAELILVENFLASRSALFQELNESYAFGIILFAQNPVLEQSEPRYRLIVERSVKCAGILKALRDELGDIPHPFVSADNKKTLAATLFEKELPPAQHYVEVFGLVAEVLEKLSGLYARIMGRLATYAEKGEEGMRLGEGKAL